MDETMNLNGMGIGGTKPTETPVVSVEVPVETKEELQEQTPVTPESSDVSPNPSVEIQESLEANNELDKAISNYLKSIAVNDKFTLAYKKVAVLFMARNDFEDAIEYFEEYANFSIPQEEKESVNKLIERIKAKQG